MRVLLAQEHINRIVLFRLAHNFDNQTTVVSISLFRAAHWSSPCPADNPKPAPPLHASNHFDSTTQSPPVRWNVTPSALRSSPAANRCAHPRATSPAPRPALRRLLMPALSSAAPRCETRCTRSQIT